MKGFIAILVASVIVSGCAAPLKVESVSFRAPETIANHQEIDGLFVAVVPIDSEERSKEIFHTDMKTANILPVHVIVRHTGTKEFEINHQQMFGIQPDGSYDVAFTIGTAAQKVRSSSIGTTAVQGAAAGAIAGAVIGAGIGAGIGAAGGDAGTGAQAGAIIGGTSGAAAGTSHGLSDSFTIEFKKQLAMHAFEDKVIYPADMAQGFVYLPWKPYQKFRMVLFDIKDGTRKEIEFPISVSR